MDFINYCDQNRILLAILPPHSTYTLQPLDVVLFKPLSTAYSKVLSTFLYTTQGLSSIKIGDFYHTFWKAWVATFTKPAILKSFEATGIVPLNPYPVVDRFTSNTPEAESDTSLPSALTEDDWVKIAALVRSAVKDKDSDESKKLSQTLHRITVENDLLHHENQGLRDALQAKEKRKKKRKKKGKPLLPGDYHGGAVFWSPYRVKRAREELRLKERNKRQQELQKAEMAEPRHANKLYKEKIAQEKREARAAAKVVREKERAEAAKQKAELAAEKQR
ncbi:nucleic acid binding [Ascochyta rabiei]|uniref:Nucleic acid binding n=1 Tax=Didymella rabiei TaxID=5454 RepID=A0A163JTD1_DIDRA|nr:nucleic acid binding [Ascochyta rabiei]